MSRSRSRIDPSFMEIALESARRFRPSPNPRVGAVVVAKGEVIGIGCHERLGKPHAEVLALGEIGNAARGADIYVTLEPCCHHGRTGPCTEVIIEAGIARAVVGMIDPDPLVNGKGVARLREAGIEVVVGISQGKCEKLLSGYTVHRTKGRPQITLKVAATLDGALATTAGESKWISSETSRVKAHEMRADSDAVLVGIGTVLKDDPMLTVRHCRGENPLRIVMDSRLRTPIDSKLISGANEAPVLLAHAAATKDAMFKLSGIDGVETLHCKSTRKGNVDPIDLATQLGKKGILSLLVEGGSSIHGAFISSGIADRAAIFFAPKILGGGVQWVKLEKELASIAEAFTLKHIELTRLGEDFLVEGSFDTK